MATPIHTHPDAFRTLRDKAAGEFLSNSRSRFRADVKAGLVTQPVKNGRNSSWPLYELVEIQQARIAGASENDIRMLVAELHERRKSLSQHQRLVQEVAA